MRAWRIAVIGGGPGGLMTAYQLQKHARGPFHLSLFEASDRLGGKILSTRFQSVPVPYEAGAAEIYDYSRVGADPLRELIAELGLSTRPMGGVAVVLDDRILANTNDIEDALGPATRRALERFDRVSKDWMSPREFYDSDWKTDNAGVRAKQSFQATLAEVGDAPARRFIETAIHSDLATEPALTNGYYGLQNYLMNDPAYMRLYAIEGGNERLPQELARRLEAAVHLSERVRAVEQGMDGKLRVHSETGAGAARVVEFDFVIVALPNNLLPAIRWGGDRLARAMSRHHHHYNYPAHYLRVSLLFERPFWRRHINESYFMLDAFGGCCLYDESSRNPGETHGVLGWLLGGEPAASLSEKTDAELIDMVLATLPPFLDPAGAPLLEGRVHRWVGAVNGLPAGYPVRGLDARHQPEPVEHPNLFVVGDYLFDSTLNGVLDSADYVAEWLDVEMAQENALRPTELDAKGGIMIGKALEELKKPKAFSQATRHQIEFKRLVSTSAAVLMEFADPEPVKAIRVSSGPEVFQRHQELADENALAVLAISGQPSDETETLEEMHAWVMEAHQSGRPLPITLTLHGTHVVWHPGRVAILAAAERLDLLLLAVVEFSFYEGELRKLEESVATGWPTLEAAIPLAYEVNTKDQVLGEEMGRETRRVLRARMRHSRLWPRLYKPPVHLAPLADQLGERLRERTGIEDRLEFLDDQLNVFERVHDMSAQRFSELRLAKKQATLEWVIIVLLAAETILILTELLLSFHKN